MDHLLYIHNNVFWQYSTLLTIMTTCLVMRFLLYFVFCTRISVNIHNNVLVRIVNSTIRFFDVNLSGNIINRFSRDLGIIDEQLAYTLYDCGRCFFLLVGVVIVISSVNPYFLIPSVGFIVMLYGIRFYYLRTGRSLQRLVGVTRSPVVGHLNASLEGLTTIRSSGNQRLLTEEFDKHLNLNNSATFMYITSTRAFVFFLDLLCSIYIGIIIFSFLLFKTNIFAGKIGLAISQAFSLTSLLQWGMRRWSELENQMTSVERILEYNNAELEEKEGDKLSDWPREGRVEYRDVSLSYSSSNEKILKDVSFAIEPKQKIGIVGRTGAGKSSIISVLYRLYDYTGHVYIDNKDIRSVDLEFLRQKISMIPQDPVLFSGTLRTNLDPYNQHTDKELWDALEDVGIKPLVPSSEGLEMTIVEGGLNFSIAQRQLICLARAIIRHNKIIVLDEATSNIDPQTDVFIQKTIRSKFADCTVITIAHRLNTVMDSDKIMVLNYGNVKEFDKPSNLLNNVNSMFYKMVKEAELIPKRNDDLSQD